MKPSHKMQEVITNIATKHDLDLKQQGATLRLTMPHYDPLVVEVLHENLVKVAHLYAPQPNVRIGDPAIAFFTGYDLWVAVEVTQRIGGYRIYATLADDRRDIIAILPTQQTDLAGFAEMWAANIVGQGWLEDGMAVDAAAMDFVDATVHWPPPTVEAPDDDQIEWWLMNDVCEASDGCLVEPDGTCPHGHPSWLLRLGLV